MSDEVKTPEQDLSVPDEWMVRTANPRTLVPSDREVAAGKEAEEYEFEEAQKESRVKLGTALRRWLSEADPRKIPGSKFPLFVLCMLPLVSNWDDAALGILAPQIMSEFGITTNFIIGLSSGLGIFTLFLAIPGGYLADRTKRVRMVRVGSIVANLSSVWQAMAPGLGHIVGARITTRIASDAIYGPAMYPLLTDYFPSQTRARVISALAVTGNVGAIVGPPLAGILAVNFGWRIAVLVLAMVATSAAILTFFLKEPIRGFWDRMDMGGPEEAARREQPPVSISEAFRTAWSSTTLRRLCYAEPFVFLSGYAGLTLAPLYYAQAFQLGPAAIGTIAAANGVVGILGLLVGAPLADRILRDRPGRVLSIMAMLILLQGVQLLILGVSPSPILSIAMSLPAAFTGAVIGPAALTLLSLVVPARNRGLGLQIFNPFRLIGYLLVFLISLWVSEAWGIRGVFIAMTPGFLIAALLYTGASLGVDRDIRAAKAASMADEAARRARASGVAKMLLCRDVEMLYQGTQVLFHVNLDVDEGELVALVGTNGAGKSTLLRAIAGIHEATNGAIFLDGRDVTHMPPHEKAELGVVMVPGGQAVFPTLTVDENLATAAWMYREDEEYVRTGREKVLEFFPILRERLSQRAGNLSGGEQQMLALGQAFLMKPRLLMIDELSLGLAPQIVGQLLDTLRRIKAEGATIILVEQSLNVALAIAERAVFMEKGEVRFDGPTRDLIRHPELVRSVFMGSLLGGGKIVTGRRRSASLEKETVLTVEDVAASFGGVQALRGVDLEVAAGEVVGVIGPNGAGKTTLFDVISGFVPVSSGRILLDATDVTALGPDARARLGVGRSFQRTRLFPSITVRENIAVAFERHLKARNPLAAAVWAPGTRRAERIAYRRVEELIRLLSLRAYADKFVDELSTGTRRAVDIACVLASEPRLLLLDEPSSGLAQAEVDELGPVLLRLVKETGCGLVVIEHDIPFVTSVSDRMMAMELGSVLAVGTSKEVTEDPRVLASYLSAPEEVLGRSGDPVKAFIDGLTEAEDQPEKAKE